MPRVLEDVACFICGNAPCTCGKPAAKKAAPKKVDVRAAMAASAKSEPVHLAPITAPVRVSEVQVSITEDQAVTNAAVRALDAAGMLHPTERRKFMMILSEAPSVNELKQLWRARRGNQTTK